MSKWAISGPPAERHTLSGDYRPASETPFEWRFGGGPIEADKEVHYRCFLGVHILAELQSWAGVFVDNLIPCFVKASSVDSGGTARIGLRCDKDRNRMICLSVMLSYISLQLQQLLLFINYKMH